MEHQPHCKPQAGGDDPAMPWEKKGNTRDAGSRITWVWSTSWAPAGKERRKSRAAASAVGTVTATNTRRS